MHHMIQAGFAVAEGPEGRYDSKDTVSMMSILDFHMISPNLIETVRACAEDFGVKSVWLFGSALEDEDQATDIDLAVEGLVPEKFFDFYGRLFFELPKPVDLVDLEQELPIGAIVRSRGVRIYER